MLLCVGVGCYYGAQEGAFFIFLFWGGGDGLQLDHKYPPGYRKSLERGKCNDIPYLVTTKLPVLGRLSFTDLAAT